MKWLTLVAVMLIAGMVSAQQLAISEETREVLCASSGGKWTYGSGCACSPDWVWQDGFGCAPFGSNPQSLCINSNGQWKYYTEKGVTACICPGASEGVAFDAKSGCPAYTPKPKTTQQQTTSISDIGSSSDLTAYLYQDINANPTKYVVYLLYFIGAIILFRVIRIVVRAFLPKAKDIVVVE